MKHIKNTPTKYEFAFKNQNGEIVFTFWLVRKSIRSAIKLATECIDRLAKETETNPLEWQYNAENGTIFSDKNHIVGKFTGRTLFEVKGE